MTDALAEYQRILTEALEHRNGGYQDIFRHSNLLLEEMQASGQWLPFAGAEDYDDYDDEVVPTPTWVDE